MRLANGLILPLILISSLGASADQPHAVQRATEFLLDHSALRFFVDDFEPHFGMEGGNPFVRRLSSNNDILAATYDNYQSACQFDLTAYSGARDKEKIVEMTRSIFMAFLNKSDTKNRTCFVTIASFAGNQHYAVLDFTINAFSHCGRGSGPYVSETGNGIAYLVKLDAGGSATEVRLSRGVETHDCRDGVRDWWLTPALVESVRNFEKIETLHSLSDRGVVFRQPDGLYIVYINVNDTDYKRFRLCAIEEIEALHRDDAPFISAIKTVDIDKLADTVLTDQNIFPHRDLRAYTLCKIVSE